MDCFAPLAMTTQIQGVSMSDIKTKAGKVENLKRIFADNYLEKPTLVNGARVTN